MEDENIKDIVNSEDFEKITLFLRSVYRYTQLIDLEAPDILMEMEDKILFDRMSEMNPVDMVLAFTIWDEFYEKQLVEDQLLDEKIKADLKNFQPN